MTNKFEQLKKHNHGVTLHDLILEDILERISKHDIKISDKFYDEVDGSLDVEELYRENITQLILETLCELDLKR